MKSGFAFWSFFIALVMRIPSVFSQTIEPVSTKKSLPEGVRISAVCPIPGGLVAAVSFPIEDHFNTPYKKAVYELREFKFAPGYGVLSDTRSVVSLRGVDVGSASFDPETQDLWFSAAWDFEKGKPAKNIRIYFKNLNNKDREPVAFMHNDPKANTAHPWLSDNGDYLFFASDRGGKSSGMDLYYCVREGTGWSDPQRLIAPVNTARNEIFPTFSNGDIYFASDRPGGRGGYDLYVATQESQWTEVIHLPTPYNSAQDDVQFVNLDDKNGYLCSGRNNGRDTWWLVQANPSSDLRDFHFIVTCKGKPLSGIPFELRHPRTGAQLMYARSDEDGRLTFRVSPEELPLSIAPVGMAELHADCLELAPLSEDGKPGKPLRKNAKGHFIFELLDADRPAPLATLPNPDTFELLTFRLEGQLRGADGRPLSEPETVSLLNEKGQIEQTVTSDDAGKFVFEKALPLEQIVLKLDQSTRALKARIEEGNRSRDFQVENQKVVYERKESESSLDITDEHGITLRIYTDDNYRLTHLYYNFGSPDLRPESGGTLSDLATILIQNPDLSVVLSAHTDSRGSAEYNQKLSQLRAESTKKALVARGVPAGKIACVGYGETRLLNNCGDQAECTEEEHALNRRTEIKLKKN